MKRFILILAVICVFFLTASCGSTSGQVYTEPSVNAPAAEQTPVPEAPVPPEQPAEVPEAAQPAVQTLPPVPEQVPAAPAAPASEPCTVKGGGYSGDVVSAFPDKDYTGADVIVVKFNFTNSNSTPNAFSNVVEVRASQDGKFLNGDYVVMDAACFGGLAYNFRNSVSNGSSVSCVYAYPSTSSSPVDVSINIYNDFNSRSLLGSGSCTVAVG